MEEAALAPPAAAPASLAAAPSPGVLSRRRVHLDSASYRALSRLFSHCLHLHPSLHAGRQDAEGELAAAAPLGDSGGLPHGGSTLHMEGEPTAATPLGDSSGLPHGGSPLRAEGEPTAANPLVDSGGLPHGGSPLHAEGEPTAATPLGDSGGLPNGGSPPPNDAGFDRGKNFEVEVALGKPWPHEIPSTSGFLDAAANPTTDPGVVPHGTPESGFTGVERTESVDEVVLSGSTSAKTGAGGEEFGAGAGLMREDDALKSMQACLDGEDNELVNEMLGDDNEQLQFDAMMTNLSGLIDDTSAGIMSVQSCGISGDELQNIMSAQSCGVSGGELQNIMSVQRCGVSGGELQNDGRVAEKVKELGAGIGSDRSVGSLDNGSIDGGGFEEGEIEGDTQNLGADDSGNSELEDEDVDGEELEEDFVSTRIGETESCGYVVKSHNLRLIPQKGNGDLALNKRCNSKDDSQMHVVRAQAVSYDEVVDWNETPLPDDKVLKHGNKRKCPLTEERKAKKTKNKRIKRAKQREAEGVKRLKLQPVIKPKVVQYCRFYLHGKCQQGTMCKFSHDTTPLTKSKPCTHFARGSCLKGDDCPYDHELSKYPCHNFMENGMCLRGDKCKFSHVVPTAEGPSTPDAKKSNASSVPEKANSSLPEKVNCQTSSQKTSTVYSGENVTSAPTKHHSILKNLAGISGNAQRAPVRIPKGIQFLPFNKARSDSGILHQGIVSTEKHKNQTGGQYQKFGRPQPEEGEEIAKHNGLGSAPLLDEKNSSKQAKLHPCSEPKKNSLPTTAAVPSSVSTQREVSEASRILQEFLFGAGN